MSFVRLLPLLFLASASAAELPAPVTRPVDFVKDIQPIFQHACVSCHGAEKQKSGFRLDLKADALRGGEDYPPAIHPGKSSESPLIRFVAGLEPKMQMPSKGDPLTPEQISLLRAWIDQGANWPDTAPGGDDPRKHHWSYQPLPAVKTPAADAANPIDAFITEKLTAAGLHRSPPADSRTLCRRLYFDLTGLPPTPEQLDAFTNSALRNPDSALSTLVDELLSSPRYGERWAQHWLDIIRWSETAGFEVNAPRPNAHPYRDYVIRSFNDDKPYDGFMFEQVAGDSVQQDAALGFLTAGPNNQPGQIGKDIAAQRLARADEQDEIIKTVGGAFLGLTVGCARCHDHKFDPITQKDYYAMQAVFAGTYYGDRRIRGGADAAMQAQVPVLEKRLATLKRDLEAARKRLGLRAPLEKEAVEAFPPVEALAVRMQIKATFDKGNPSITELEILATEGREFHAENVALASHGSVATASSYAFANQTRHPENLNDGKQEFPWEAKERTNAWVMITFAHPERISMVRWFASGKGAPADYVLEVQLTNGVWKQVADGADRLPALNDMRAAKDITLRGCTPQEVSGIVSSLTEQRQNVEEQKRLRAGPLVFAAVFRDAEPAHRLRRGDPMQPQEEIAPDAPTFLGGLHLPPSPSEPERRAALGKWLTDPKNPLPARVMVNRLYQHHFGQGLVDTPSDFGAKGTAPSHPELLDWLAREFIASGWSVKHMHKLIVTSQTYQQSSAITDPHPESIDADCRLLWRFPSRRLEAEAVRDAILFASGQLDFSVPDGVKKTPRGDRHRMVYATKRRMVKPDVFGALDCPDGGQMTAQRTSSITPVQAAGLLNSEFIMKQSKALAGRVKKRVGEDEQRQAEETLRLVVSRAPTEEEKKTLATFIHENGLEQLCRVLFNTNEFVFQQ